MNKLFSINLIGDELFSSNEIRIQSLNSKIDSNNQTWMCCLHSKSKAKRLRISCFFWQNCPYFVCFLIVVPTVELRVIASKMLQFVVGSSMFKCLHAMFYPYIEHFLNRPCWCAPISVYRPLFPEKRSTSIMHT